MTSSSSPGADRQPPARVVIVGAGPAGLAAAIQAARARLQPVLIAGEAALPQLVAAGEIDNYPGFPEPIEGADLLALFRQQAERFGAAIVDADATAVDFAGRPFRVDAAGTSHAADVVILAVGASAGSLGLESEETFRGRGVSTCATCDGFFFRNRSVAVVGDGDTALEEALFLTRFASHVRVLVPGERFVGGSVAQERVLAHPAIEVRWNTELVEIRGDATVSGAVVRDRLDGGVTEMPVNGVFVAVGYRPDTTLIGGRLRLDEHGFVVVDDRGTGIDGVFVAGDLRDHAYRQVAVAVGDGCRAAIDAERWLERTAGVPVATSTNW